MPAAIRPTPMSAAVDPRYCPLCGQANQCAIELARSTGLPRGPCWCMQQSIAPETLAQIDPAALNRACLCPRCAALPANHRSQPPSPTS